MISKQSFQAHASNALCVNIDWPKAPPALPTALLLTGKGLSPKPLSTPNLAFLAASLFVGILATGQIKLLLTSGCGGSLPWTTGCTSATATIGYYMPSALVEDNITNTHTQYHTVPTTLWFQFQSESTQ